MRHRLFGSFLIAATSTLVVGLVACGPQFEAGTHEEDAGTGEDGGPIADAGHDAGTKVVGPSGGSGQDAGVDASDAHEVEDATPDAPQDATDDAPAEAPDAATPCPAGEKLCGNTCVAKNSPLTGCGETSCAPCSLPNATATCDTSDVCAVDTCSLGFDHCTGPVSGGCETPVSTTSNCGGCGKTCTTSDPDCSATGNTFTCTNGCVAGEQPCGGSCVNEATSPTSCGGCGASFTCAAPSHGTASCANSKCGFSCQSGYNECNDNECVSLTTDPLNCGACGKSCAVPANGHADCAPLNGVGTCGITCTAPYLACGSVCEAQESDVNNCGACGKVCPVPVHGTATCAPPAGTQVGACGIACSNGYSACGNACVNEQDDNNNCGACNKICGAVTNGSDQCTSGSCLVSCNANYHVCSGACFPNADLPTQDPCEITETYGVFVSSSLGNDANAGTRTAPFKTIGKAITAAATAGKRVYACAESYAEADVLASNVSLFGYFTCTGGTWAVGTGYASVISTSIPAVKAVNVTNVRIESIHWTAPDAPPSAGAGASGSTSYGMFATGSKLTLNNVGLFAGSGSAGVSGAPGSGLVVSTPCGVSTGASATTAGNNGAAHRASFSAAGFTTAAGTAGGIGSSGQNGTAGGLGDCEDVPTSCTFDKVDNTCDDNGQQCGATGSPGCGGAGGAPGGAGGGGGASVGLFAWASTISVSGGSLESKNGGAGGAGTAGGAAGASTSGAAGVAWTGTAGSCVRGTGATCNLGAPYGQVTAAGGAAGGKGGAGSAGGSGAGGTGGDTYSYYAGGSASVTLASSPTMSNGLAGSAGGGPLPGFSGYGGPTNTGD